MIDLTGVSHHPAIEEIATVLANKTQNADLGFFRTEVAYFLAKMAASMRAMVVTKDRGEIPVNLYAMLLATSGFGKGHSIGIMEEDFLFGFRRRFMENTFPELAEQTLWELANGRAARNGTDQQEEMDKAKSEFRKKGAFPFTFDSGTIPAVKQLRDKLLLGGSGSINFQVDEIGLNLINSVEVLTVFLELFDQGKTKIKLTKNGVDNERGEDLDGKTPANMLLFGTPSKLFDGGNVEDQFWAFMETGYARRCLFGYGTHQARVNSELTPEETYLRLIEPSNDAAAHKWSNHFHSLADPVRFNWRMEVDDDVGIMLMTYKMQCEKLAEAMPTHNEIQKAEMAHRYFKTLKIAGTFAFIDESSDVEMEHLMSAILLVEEAGKSFQRIMKREPSYIRLAKYVADVGMEVTQSDLVETLPYYSGSLARRNDMMSLATSWGYTNHIVIKKRFVDNIEFFKGETLKETNLDELRLSYSDHWAYRYQNETAPFSELHTLTGEDDMHWCNHHFKEGHRLDDNAIAGFNMIVVDCDGDVSLDTVREVMKDYTYFIHTTKSHQNEAGLDRFRLVLPINYFLELDQDEYREFMNSILAWLPFKSDEGANQRARKWMTCAGSTHMYNEGKLLDALDFIPKTRRNDEHRKTYQALENLDNLERWFAQRIATGSRNTQMIKYALALVDSGMNLVEVQGQVHSFNKKLSDPLSEDELDNTVLVTVAKRFQRTAA